MPFRNDQTDPEINPHSEIALVIMLPTYLDQLIASVRERFDPNYHFIKSHITLVFPFSSDRSVEDVSRVVKNVVQRFPPFQIELSSIGDFYPDSPIIYWGVKKNPDIDNLYKSLYTELDLAIPHRQFCPHVTVAREISTHRLMITKETICLHLPDADFFVKEIEMVSPGEDHVWNTIQTFPLLSE